MIVKPLSSKNKSKKDDVFKNFSVYLTIIRDIKSKYSKEVTIWNKFVNYGYIEYIIYIYWCNIAIPIQHWLIQHMYNIGTLTLLKQFSCINYILQS